MTGVQQALLMAGQSWIDPTWAQATAPAARRWTTVSYGNGVFAAGGNNTAAIRPCAMYSLDNGETWTVSPTAFPDTGGTGFREYCMAYGLGVFVGNIGIGTFASSDGINWSVIGSSGGGHVEFGNSVFITSVTSANTCRRSTNGSTWTPISLPSSDTWSGVGFGSNGTWIIFSNTGCIRSTNNGLAWTAGGALPFGTNVNTAAYGNGVWVATASSNTTVIYHSVDDGITWTSKTVSGVSIVYQRVRFINGVFFMLSQSGSRNFTSTDGVTWTMRNTTVNTASFTMDMDYSAAGAAVRYVAVGNGGSNTTVTNYGIG